MIFLWLALSLSQACDRHLANKMFSPEAIARAIGDLGQDGPMFSHMLHGIPYEKIAKRFNVTVEEVLSVAKSGHALLMYYKDQGL